MYFADYKNGCQAHLSLGVVLALIKMRVIDLYFGPELAVDTILECVVPGKRASNRSSVSRGQAHAESSLHVEIAETFPVSDRGRDDRVRGTVSVLTGGQAHAEERGEDVATALFVFRENAVLEQERKIAEAVPHRRVVVREIGRRA